MKVNFVVVDSGPIIKGAILQNFSKHAISVPGVIKEIKDVKTRERIRNLPPYFFSIRSPSDEAIKHVINISKKTGDFKVLSKVDLEVLALAYEMENLKSPDQVEQMFEKLQIDSDLESDDDESNPQIEHFNNESDSESMESIEITDSEDADESEILESKDIDETHSHAVEITDLVDNEKEEETTYMTTENDNDGWITEENFDEMKSQNLGFSCDTEKVSIEKLEDSVNVGCLTTDYAMQNVLLHMNIHILSVDGMVIKEPRIFVTYCRSCFKKFKRTDIFFCPNCGNECVGKIPAKIKENGEIELFFRKNFLPNLRNTKFTIPTPKGGKHTDGNTYIYCADQRLPQERTKKSKWTFDINEDGNLPFMIHEVTAKSSVLGINQNRSQNLRPSRPKGNKRSNRK